METKEIILEDIPKGDPAPPKYAQEGYKEPVLSGEQVLAILMGEETNDGITEQNG